MKYFIILLLSVFVVLQAPGAHAVEPDEVLSDPVLELRARDISKNLRCLVCQNQSIDDSNAPLAKDLRVLVRERLVAGDSDSEVIEFVVARYGDYVLLKPPLKLATVGLWFGPAAIFLLGGLAVIVFMRRNRARPLGEGAAQTLNAEEQRAFDRILETSGSTHGEPSGSTPGKEDRP